MHLRNEEEIRIYYAGLREGLKRFAWWRDGTQYVGSCGVSLNTALSDVDHDEKLALADVNYYNGGKL